MLYWRSAYIFFAIFYSFRILFIKNAKKTKTGKYKKGRKKYKFFNII
ncbi:hypothetical protein UNSWCS_825 [Campylobacter concisus UNSWCS]|uniref:Uncharacterized protein n=1 Tax=Campylobacter concisus UNSWCS TaxID=1242968 RepID=U2FBG9_9BACT|nr:hypothetical protein UNSWCS_825 [Campylobacter concisus UNSWCS]